MQTDWLVLLPPFLVIALAFLTHRVLLSLILGIIAGALIVSNFSIIGAVQILSKTTCAQFDPSNLYTFGFLLVLGSLISLISLTGGTLAYGALIKKRLLNARMAESASVLLSFCFAIDDFFSILTVGSIMKPVTDTFKIPRVKLAFLLDSLAAPLIILVPVSTWVAMILMQLEKAGISTNSSTNPLIFEDPLAFYLQTIPFVFYSFLIAFSVIFIVRTGSSWGPMAQAEELARKKGDIFWGAQAITSSPSALPTNGSIIDFIFPIATLLLSVFASILYLGDSSLLGGTHSLAQTMQHTDIFLALFAGACVAFISSFALALMRGSIKLGQLSEIVNGGYLLMKDSIAILFLAWAFGTLLKNDLHTGDYIASLIVGSVNASFLPAAFFLAALVTAVGTGSSWGTIAVLVPLAIPLVTSFISNETPLALHDALLTLPVIGAIFAGAVAGDHVSPIGTTTIMSAATAQTEINAHVYSQLPYAAPALVGAFFAFLSAGYLIKYGIWSSCLISLFIGALIALALLIVQRKTS